MEDPTTTDGAFIARSTYQPPPYLTTHRALAACTREVARLTDDLVRGAEALSMTLGVSKPLVRRPPGRCIVQLGPVALTVVWLRSTLDSAATGELLVNVWRGAVSPRSHYRTERPSEVSRSEPATLLWEQVLLAEAETESTWRWRPMAGDALPVDTSALASTCVAQLRLAYADTLTLLQEHA